MPPFNPKSTAARREYYGLPKKKKKPPRVPPRTPPTKPMSIEEWATQQAEKRVNAEVEAIRAQQAIFEQERQAAMQRQIEQAQRMAAYIQAQGFDKQISDLYRSAGSDVAGMAQGFAGDTRQIAAADAAAQMNMLSGTGQEGAVRDQGTNMGDVLYGVGGWIPGKNLGETGAAAAANAALQPAFTLRQGQEDAMAAFQESGDQLSEFARAIAEAKAGKFSYKEELVQQRREAALDQQAFNLKRLESDRDYWLKQQALFLSQGKLKLARQAEKRAAAIERRYQFETQGRDFEGNLMPGYHLGPQGQVIPPGYKVDRQGNVVKMSTARGASGSKKPKYTPAQQLSIMDTVVKAEDSIQEALIKAVRDGTWTPSSGNPKARAALGRKLFAQYKHLAGTYQPALKRLRQIIASLLNEATKLGPPSPSTAGGSDSFWDVG